MINNSDTNSNAFNFFKQLNKHTDNNINQTGIFNTKDLKLKEKIKNKR